MEEFTLIYTEIVRCGSHSNSTTHIERIRTNDIRKAIDSFSGAVVFVFNGHPKQQGEFEFESKIVDYKF